MLLSIYASIMVPRALTGRSRVEEQQKQLFVNLLTKIQPFMQQTLNGIAN